MIPVIVRQMTLGEGLPKICVPNTGKTKEEILALAADYRKLPMDFMEWRADWFQGVGDADKVLDVLVGLRAILGDLPLLFTFRTKKEGGVTALSTKAYAALNVLVAQSKLADLIDVEIFTDEGLVPALIAELHVAGAKIVASNHDFAGTPAKADILYRLRKMQDLGADVLKIAVMPQTTADVLTLLSATEEMRTCYAVRPLITMSMAGLGSISRIAGEVFGSCVTFGSGAAASAPGQLDARTLQQLLQSVHNSL